MINPITVLYVDDEPINLMLFDVCFKEKYNVLTAKSGDEGLVLLDQHNEISVCFSDMKMPGMNGVEFINLAKKKYPEISYYILTGFSLTDEIQKALEDGLIRKCLFKPFDIEDIEAEINRLS
jgi:response regulator RpfG family c-di-GMP phosphodiesterase